MNPHKSLCYTICPCSKPSYMQSSIISYHCSSYSRSFLCLQMSDSLEWILSFVSTFYQPPRFEDSGWNKIGIGSPIIAIEQFPRSWIHDTIRNRQYMNSSSFTNCHTKKKERKDLNFRICLQLYYLILDEIENRGEGKNRGNRNRLVPRKTSFLHC